MRREVPLLLTFLFGAFYVLSNFIVWDRWKIVAESVNNWVFIIIAFTYVLGVGNVLRIHGLKISRRESGWAYSAATISGLLVMILFGNRMDVSGDARRFLDIVLGPIGFALIRDRFLEATRAAS